MRRRETRGRPGRFSQFSDSRGLLASSIAVPHYGPKHTGWGWPPRQPEGEGRGTAVTDTYLCPMLSHDISACLHLGPIQGRRAKTGPLGLHLGPIQGRGANAETPLRRQYSLAPGKLTSPSQWLQSTVRPVLLAGTARLLRRQKAP